MKKISILHENMLTCKPTDFYSDVITAPPTRNVRHQYLSSLLPQYFLFSLGFFFVFVRLLQTVSNREVEVHTEDEQTFLARQQQLLMNGQPPSSGRGDDQSFLNRQQQMLMDGHSAGNRSESPMRTQTIGSIKSSPRAQVCVRASTIFCFAFKLKSVNNHK